MSNQPCARCERAAVKMAQARNAASDSAASLVRSTAFPFCSGEDASVNAPPTGLLASAEGPRYSPHMIFEEIRSGGCCSYVVACDDTCAGVIVDPERSQISPTLAPIGKAGVHVHYVVDTPTHADHFSASRELARRLGVPRVMHRASVAPGVDVRIDDGETLIAGRLRIRAIATPGHTDDSISLVLPDRVLTGDTLLRGATGRTDLPTGDPEALYDSLFGKLLRLDDTLAVYPGHNYKNTPVTTIGQEKAENPRLQKR